MNTKLLLVALLGILVFSIISVEADETAPYTPQTGTSSSSGTQGTSNNQYTVEQDSVFEHDSRISLNFMFWLIRGLDRSEGAWLNWFNQNNNTPSNSLAIAFSRMPANIFEPLESERVQFEINKANALSIPTVYNFSESGVNFNLRNIGLFLGLVEDVSPEITYTLAITADVEVLVYSISAKVVRTLFTGTQKPGKYTMNWNGKDDAGKKLPSGDYIAEVRVGAEKFVRKRIVIE